MYIIGKFKKNALAAKRDRKTLPKLDFLPVSKADTYDFYIFRQCRK